MNKNIQEVAPITKQDLVDFQTAINKSFSRLENQFIVETKEIKEKVENIRSKFTSDKRLEESVHSEVQFCEFTPLSCENVLSLIKASANKSCILDPVPTSLLRKCLITPSLVSFITNLINSSLSTGIFPKQFKVSNS